MFSVQSNIGPNPLANLGSGTPPSSGTLVRFIVMSNIGYLFGWKWNSGVSAQTINLIRSVPPLSHLPYPRGSNVSSGVTFLGNVNIFGSRPFLRGTYPPSNFWKQGGN